MKWQPPILIQMKKIASTLKWTSFKLGKAILEIFKPENHSKADKWLPKNLVNIIRNIRIWVPKIWMDNTRRLHTLSKNILWSTTWLGTLEKTSLLLSLIHYRILKLLQDKHIQVLIRLQKGMDLIWKLKILSVLKRTHVRLINHHLQWNTSTVTFTI